MTFTGYIYKLTGACGKVYIGSTADFDSRVLYHKSKSNGCNSRLLLKPILDEIIDTREYILIKSLRLVEQFYLDNINNINSRRAYTNKKKYQKKYYEENKKKILEYQKQWRKRNPEKVKEMNKIKEQKMKEKDPEKYRKDNNERSKLYRQRHLEKVREKERLTNIKNKENVKCECGCIITKWSLSRHKKTKKHLKLIRI
jgi:hypothetical protein